MVVTKTNPPRKRLARTLTAKRDDMEGLAKGICVLAVKLRNLSPTLQQPALKQRQDRPVSKLY